MSSQFVSPDREASLTETIKAKAYELGFAKVAVSRAEKLDARNNLEVWLAAGNHGEMLWMGR
ncbi:MAG TPA: tRNA epoxyqueuosine(34) reductase QueG, partial [Terriglobia bacterium]|nr:tRNA epoxyqueuosine(34) reductase QueG [Terriglobia bacterium]